MLYSINNGVSEKGLVSAAHPGTSPDWVAEWLVASVLGFKAGVANAQITEDRARGRLRGVRYGMDNRCVL